MRTNLSRKFVFILTAVAFLGTYTGASYGAEILFIGDSHSVGVFGSTLSKAVGAKRYAVGGTSAVNWNKKAICPKSTGCPYRFGYATPKGEFGGSPPPSFPGLQGLLEEANPAVVIIALGTNDACESVSPASKLVSLTKGKTCVWVGPPDFKKDSVIRSRCAGKYDQFVQSLKAAVSSGSCAYIDSTKLKDSSGNFITADAGDKVHFTSGKAKQWASAVRAELQKLGL